MNYRFRYTNPEERQQIINDNSHLRCIAEENITDGNFITFTDEPVPEPKPTYEELENQVLLLTDQLAGGIL
jgi:hypothetical protein